MPESLLDTTAAVDEQQAVTEELAPSLEDSDGLEGRDDSVPDLPVE